MVSTIRRELQLTSYSQFNDLLVCPMSRDAYISIVRDGWKWENGTAHP